MEIRQSGLFSTMQIPIPRRGGRSIPNKPHGPSDANAQAPEIPCAEGPRHMEPQIPQGEPPYAGIQGSPDTLSFIG